MKQIKRIHILLIILVVSYCIFTYKYPTIKENLTSDIKEIKNTNENYTVRYEISPNCPRGTDKMLADSKVKVEHKIIECGLSDDKYIYYGEELKIWYVTYGTIIIGGDVQLGKSIHILQKPDGNLFLDFGLAGLKDKIISSAKKETSQEVGDSNDRVNHSMHELERYFKLQDSIYGPNDKGQYCGNFSAFPPIQGKFTICQGVGAEYESYDKNISTTGVLPYIAAKELAITKARSLYLDKVQYKNPVSQYMSQEERSKLGTGTFLADYIVKWRYYESADGYWIFIIREKEASKKIPASSEDGFDNDVRLKVQNDKKVCVLESKPYSIRSLSLEAYDKLCQN